MVNKYEGKCAVCGWNVAANAGTVERRHNRFIVRHLACASSPEVISIRTSGGSFTQNRKGRCEDAPACGCCTI